MMILIKIFGFYVSLLMCTIGYNVAIIHKCVKEVPEHIIDKDITHTTTILIFIPNFNLKEIDDVIKDISNRSTKNSLIIVNSADSLGMMEDIKITHYFIYFESLGKLNEIFKNMKNLIMMSHQPHLFLIALNKFRNIGEIFYFAVNFHTSIIKLMLLIETSSNTCNLYRTTFFKHFSCHPKRQDNYQLIDLCVEGKFKSNTSWSNHETPYKFQSCQLNVVYLNIPPYVLYIKNNSVLMLNGKKTKEYNNNLHGTEVGMLSNIFRTMNVSLRFINGNELGEVFNNSTVTGSLKFLVDKQADIAIGGYSKNPSRFKYFDCSLAYHQEYASWAVPNQEFSVKYIARIIHFNILIGVAIIVCSISAIIVIVARYNKFEREYFRNPTNVLFQLAIVSIINFPVSILPKTAGIRLIYILLLMFSLIFNVAFVTFLASVLTQHKLSQKYANYNDILEDKLHVYMVPNSDRFFANTTDLVNLNLMKLAEICPVTKFMDCINDVAVNKNSAFLAQNGFLDYAKMSMISKNNENNIHLLPPIVAYPINFIMRKGFWATQRVNQLILIAFETGLTKKWMEVPFYANPKRNLREQNEKKSEDTNLLWIILFTGYLLSSVVLVIEILIYRRKLTQK